jgi:hypothetical protein
MSDSCRKPMDFEQWRQLASQNPAEFEERRRELIEAMIGSASKRCQQRLRGLQWRIDQVREHSPTPMAACISLSNMMWESFAGVDGLAQTLNTRHFTGHVTSHEAQILPFASQRK